MEKNREQREKIVIVLFCILINIVGKNIAEMCYLPLWLDVIGTGVAAYYAGPVGAVITGIINNFAFGMIDPTAIAYVLVSIAIGLFIVFLEKKGYMETLTKALVSGVLVGVFSSILSSVINIFVFGGTSGNVWGDTIYDMLIWNGVSSYFAAFCGEAMIDIPDKLISLVAAFGVICLIRRSRSKNNGLIGRKFIIGCMAVLTSLVLLLVVADVFWQQQQSDENVQIVEQSYYNEYRDEASIVWDDQTGGENIFAGNYVEQIYSGNNGMFSSEVNAIAETADGYIWFGSYAGLTRYDGKTFEYVRESGLASVTVLVTDTKDRLWIGTNDGGLARYDNGTYTFFTKADGMPASAIRSLVEMPDGTMYVGTTDHMCKITTTDQIQVIEENITYVTSMVQQNGRIIGVTNAGLLFLMKDDVLLASKEVTREGAYYQCVGQNDRQIMAGTSDGYIDCISIEGDRLILYKQTEMQGFRNISAIRTDRQGRTWIGADSGMGYFDHAGNFYTHSYEGFENSIEDIHEDYEGNFWFASSGNGVMKLSHNNFINLFAASGISPEATNGICEYKDAYYCGTDKGLFILDRESCQPIDNELTRMLDGERIRFVSEDSKGSLWICSYSKYGLVRYDADETITTYTVEEQGATSNRFRCMLELEDGTIVTGNNNGINFIRGDEVIGTITGEDGLENEQVLCLIAGENGAFYAGTDGAGIYKIENMQITEHISTENGLTSDIILRMVPYRTGYFVVASNGLCYMENNAVRKLSQFPYLNNYDILLHDNEAYVLSSSGIYVVNAEQLFYDEELQYKLYNHTEGLLNALIANSWNYINDSGRIYFCTNQGVSCFDISSQAQGRRRYKFDIALVTADGQTITEDNRIYRIPENAGNVIITPSVRNYTLSDVKLQIFMEGLDTYPSTFSQKDIEPIQISRIPAGTYQIQLKILSNDESMVLQEKDYILIKEAHAWENTVFMVYLVFVLSLSMISIIWVILNYFNLMRNKKDLEEMKLQAKNDFLTKMSHEIRTPVNAIIGMDEMILRSNPDGRIENYACQIQNAAEKLLALINDVLDFSTIESGKLSITVKNYRLDEMLNDMISLLDYRAGEKNLEIRLDIQKDLPRLLSGDLLRIKQIISNLLTNAVKNTGQGYIKLVVTGEITEPGKIILSITVEDTGIGIRQEDMDRVFGSFTKLSKKKGQEEDGIGLGLNITKKLVDLMEGEISVESTYGGGAAFTVKIPQQIKEEHPIGDLKQVYLRKMRQMWNSNEQFTASDACILSVDDNDISQEIVQGLLKNTMVRITTAMSGKEALELCKSKKFDLILMDRLMPEMDGIETLRELRSEEENLNNTTPAIMLTSESGEQDQTRETYRKNGFVDYLSKPFSAVQLKEILRLYLPKEKIHIVSGQSDERTEEKVHQAEQIKPETLHIDQKAGMKYCAGNEEMYREILDTFRQQKERYHSGLKSYSAKADLKHYEIMIHSLKSTALTIGASELSEQARRHEEAAKKKDLQTIRDSLDSFLELYDQVLQEIDGFLSV